MNETQTIRNLEELIDELDTCIASAKNLRLIISTADFKDLVNIRARLANKTNKLKANLSEEIEGAQL
jgi:hypothetical protein